MRANSEDLFFEHAIQTTYCWMELKYYGSESNAIKSLSRRRSANGKDLSKCAKAFSLGVCVIQRAKEILSEELSKRPEFDYRDPAQRGSVEDELRQQLRQTLPHAPDIMLNYAISMLFHLPGMR